MLNCYINVDSENLFLYRCVCSSIFAFLLAWDVYLGSFWPSMLGIQENESGSTDIGVLQC